MDSSLALADMTLAQLWKDHRDLEAHIQAAMHRQRELHEEITRREHAYATRKRNPDATKDAILKGL